jgi:NADH dehydrogenase
LIFGQGDILLNNIAWLLRRFPVFFVPGNGHYRVQPVAGEDVAEIAIWAASVPENVTVDAAGPEIIAYAELVESIAIAIHHTRTLFFAAPRLTLFASRFLGRFVKDVILTPEELAGLMEELLVSKELPRGRTRLDDWLLRSHDTLGQKYASELDRHFRPAL